MMHQKAKRCLSLVMALALLFPLLPVESLATAGDTGEQNVIETTVPTEATAMAAEEATKAPMEESAKAVPEAAEETIKNTEPETVESLAVQEIQATIDDILIRYLGDTEVTSDKVEAKVNDMDWETYQNARWEIHTLARSEIITQLTETDKNKLSESNAVFSLFYTALEENKTGIYDISLLGEKTALDGQVTISCPDGTPSVNGTTVTYTAWASLWNETTSKITITNSSTTASKLTFTYKVSGNEGAFKLNDVFAVNGSTLTLTKGQSATFSITAPGWGYCTLTLSDLAIETIEINSTNVTFVYETGSVTVGTETLSASGTAKELSTESATTITASGGSNFVAWINTATHEIVSSTASFSFMPTETVELKAVYGPNARFTIGGTFLYETFSEALTCASGASAPAKTIVLANNGTLPAGDYTIPAGVTLLIPRDSANSMTTTTPNTIEPTNFGNTPPAVTSYRKLTMAQNAAITVNGAISIAGTQWAGGKYISATGAAGFIHMNNGSSITVNNGGFLYAWGFITGSGGVTTEPGGTVYEQFQVAGWRGGDMTSTMINSNKYGVFPMSQYYVQNIEVPLTLKQGAKEYAFASANISLIGITPISVAFVGESGSLFQITSGYVVKDYIEGEDRLKVKIHGDVSLTPIEIDMKLGILGNVTLETVKFDLPINNNMTIHGVSGTLTLNQDVALLPGTQIIVDEGVTCTLGTGVNVYVYDAAEWGTYCGSVNVKFLPIPNVPGRTGTRTEADLIDSSICINGTLDASQGYLYTTAGGANIHSTGTGIVKTQVGTQTATHQVVQAGEAADSTYPEIPITPAKLLNGDGSYTETAAYGAGTYKYINGKWYKTFDIVASNLAVNDGLDMWFYVKYEDVAGITSNYNAVVTKEFADDRSPNPITETISGTKWVAYDQNNDGTFDYYRFKFSDISAKEMTDQLTAVVLHTDNIQVSNTYEQTVQNYAITMLDHYKSTTGDGKIECLKKALMDMLEYGASAQAQFKNYNIENLANVAPSGVTTLTDHSGYITTTTPTCESKKVYDDGVAGVTVSATNTLLFTFYFNVSDTTGMYAEIKYTPHGETAEQTVTVNAEDFYERVAGSLYGVDVKGLSVVDGRQVMTCTLYDNTGKAIATATDSIEGYAYRNAENGDIFMDMMRFVDSALAYFDYAA